jgi:hypothetical protein
MEMEDKIINAILDVKDDIGQIRNEMATRTDVAEINTRLDQQGQILQRLDQERLFTLERIKRIEADVEQMKVVLKIA